MAKLIKGSELGRFTLIERIDDERGGNCNVWLAEADGSATRATRAARSGRRPIRIFWPA